MVLENTALQAKPLSSAPRCHLLETSSEKEERGRALEAHLGVRLFLSAICMQSCTNCTRPGGGALLGPDVVYRLGKVNRRLP